MPWIVVDCDDKQERVAVARTPKGVWVGWGGGSTFVSKELSFASVNQYHEDDVVAPMTGKVVNKRAARKVFIVRILIAQYRCRAMHIQYWVVEGCPALRNEVDPQEQWHRRGNK